MVLCSDLNDVCHVFFHNKQRREENVSTAVLVSTMQEPFSVAAYQPSYAPVCTSITDSAAVTNPAPAPPNPTTGIIAFCADVFFIVANERKPFVTKGGVQESFSIKLSKMLEHIDLHDPELTKIVSWQSDERLFLVMVVRENGTAIPAKILQG